MIPTRRDTLLALGSLAAAATLPVLRPARAARPVRIAVVAKSLGNGFFDAVHTGGAEAAKALGVELIFTGPTDTDAAKQVDVVNALAAQHVDAICISANDPDALVPACHRAMQRGIKVMSYDSGVAKAGRILNLSDATETAVGQTCDQLAAAAAPGGRGKVAIVSATATSTNQNSWIAAMKQALPSHPGLDLVSVVYGDDLSDKSYREATVLLQKYDDLAVIIAPSTVAITASAKAVSDANKTGRVFVTGLGLPSECAGAVRNGVIRSFAIWNPLDIGYATVEVASALVRGQGGPGQSIPAGRLGSIGFDADGNGTLGKPTVYDRSNIDAAAKVF